VESVARPLSRSISSAGPPLPHRWLKGKTFVVAEVEVMVNNIVRIALAEMGIFVLTASDGEQALELSRKFPGSIHALVSDVVIHVNYQKRNG
jgi:hypothetical protein